MYKRVFTRSVHQPLVYAFGVPATRLRVWCTPEALTNQGGGASVYRLRSLLNRIDSHHRLNEHTILYVFRAPRHDSLIPLNWYQQIVLVNNYYLNYIRKRAFI